LALEGAVGRNLAQSTAFEIGQLEILEHDLDQFIQRDVGFVVINPRTVACLSVALALAFLAGLAHDLARTCVAVTLAGAGRVLAIDEPVLLDPAQRNLDHAIAIFADDRFLGDYVRDVLADRLANLLTMSRAIASRAVGMLGVGAAVIAKDTF